MAREARRSLSATRVVGLKMRRCDDEFIDVCRRERALKQSPRGTRGEALGIFPYRGGRTRREFRLALSRRSFVFAQDYRRLDVIESYYSFLKRILQIRALLVVVQLRVHAVNLFSF